MHTRENSHGGQKEISSDATFIAPSFFFFTMPRSKTATASHTAAKIAKPYYSKADRAKWPLGDETITVGMLKRQLAALDDSLPLIYSHDDEGNEKQFVVYNPSVTFIKPPKSYRFLEVLTISEDGMLVDKEDKSVNAKSAIRCVCIN